MADLKFWLLFLWCTYNPLPPLFPFRWSGFDSLYDIYPFKRPGTIDSVQEIWQITGIISLFSGAMLMVIPIVFMPSPSQISFLNLTLFITGFMWCLRGSQLIKSRPIH